MFKVAAKSCLLHLDFIRPWTIVGHYDRLRRSNSCYNLTGLSQPPNVTSRMNPIIALWAHPRSMSTAVERIMRTRGDLSCFHEPFLSDYYFNRSVRMFPHFEVEQNQPVTYEQARDMIITQAQTTPVFFKDMSFYVMPHILDDTTFGDRLINVFIIRNPVASIPSYFKLDPDVTLAEIGLQAQWQHFEALSTSAGTMPLVIQAEDIRANAKKVIGRLWQQIGLPSSNHAFEWRSDIPEEWQQVRVWHKATIDSSGIRMISDQEVAAQTHTFKLMSDEYPQMSSYLAHHQPFYENLKARAIRI